MSISTSEPWFVEFVEPGAKPEVLSTVLVLKKRERFSPEEERTQRL
jgi:hypothetical protein